MHHTTSTQYIMDRLVSNKIILSLILRPNARPQTPVPMLPRTSTVREQEIYQNTAGGCHEIARRYMIPFRSPLLYTWDICWWYEVKRQTYFRSPTLLRSVCGIYDLGLTTLITPLYNIHRVIKDYLQLRVCILKATLHLQKAELRALRARYCIKWYDTAVIYLSLLWSEWLWNTSRLVSRCQIRTLQMKVSSTIQLLRRWLPSTHDFPWTFEDRGFEKENPWRVSPQRRTTAISQSDNRAHS